MAFWMSLVYAGGKAIGLEERSKILFEQGILDFPQNFPDTESYKQLSLEKYREAKKLYLKRPPGKRVNFEKIRVYYPFHSPWGNLIFGDEQNTSSLLEEPISISILFTSKPYTVIRHDDQLEELSNLLFPTNFNLAENENITKIKKQWVPKSSSSYTSKKGEAIYLPIPDYFKSSLVAVTLRFINKGNPSKHGMIYEPTQEDYLEWKKTNSNSASLDFKVFFKKI